jgi:hypothetical protein
VVVQLSSVVRLLVLVPSSVLVLVQLLLLLGLVLLVLLVLMVWLLILVVLLVDFFFVQVARFILMACVYVSALVSGSVSFLFLSGSLSSLEFPCGVWGQPVFFGGGAVCVCV